MSKRRPGAEPCPCGSGASYRGCCEPYHAGGEPPDPAALVRSRFSAFALGEGDYLVRTLHPGARTAPDDVLARSFANARRTLRYRALILHEVEAGEDRARVLFTARIFERGRDRSFTELSRFERTEGGWRYVDGDLAPAEGAPETIAAFEARATKGPDRS